MSAMRLYTREELEKELTHKWDLNKTDEITETQQFWKTPGGNFVPFVKMNDEDRYPDSLLDDLLRRMSEIDSQ